MAERIADEKERIAQLEAEIAQLQDRLQESEDTIRAIRAGEVDAFVVQFGQGQRVFSLRGSEHVYHAFVEQMRDGALTLAEDNMIVYSNRRFLDMLGIPHASVIGSNLIDHMAPEDRYLAEALMQRARQRESSAELSLSSRDTEALPVHMRAFPLDVEGVPTVCVLVTDMTEIHRYRYDLERMVEARTAELEARLTEYGQLADARSQLVARLALELDKPLQAMADVVGGFGPKASELEDAASVPLYREGIALVENSLVRLNALRQDVAMLSEADAGVASLAPAPVCLKEVVLEAVEQAGPIAREKGVEFVTDLPESEVSFITDTSKVRQVIVALLLACVESVEVGPVRVRADVSPELVAAVEICSPGNVLPYDDIQSLLEGRPDDGHLRRISDTVPAMSIWAAQRVAHLLDGRLTIARGATHDCFVFELPL